MYHPQVLFGGGVDESFAECNLDFSLMWISALSIINVKTLTKITKAS